MRRFVFALVIALAGAGALLGTPPRPFGPMAPGRIFVANGSGDATNLTENLREVISNQRLPLSMETIRWTNYGGPAHDHNDVRNHRRFGMQLACRVQAFQQACPTAKIYLMGHSSGTHVILAAAEALGPGSVDRIVLAAPSVSATYDVRPALDAAREGMDVYCSLQDGVLDVAVDMFGTADGRREVPAAGQVGFRVPPCQHPDFHLYHGLRQYHWRPTMECIGNNGTHYGAIRVGYLRTVVLPNMVTPPH